MWQKASKFLRLLSIFLVSNGSRIPQKSKIFKGTYSTNRLSIVDNKVLPIKYGSNAQKDVDSQYINLSVGNSSSYHKKIAGNIIINHLVNFSP